MIPTSTGISSAQKKKNSQFFSYSLEIKEQRKKKGKCRCVIKKRLPTGIQKVDDCDV